VPDSLEILQERLASLEQQLQDYGNRTRRLEIDVPKGVMLPYFSNILPESGDYVWADGQTNWPAEDWVPKHLRGQPVPDTREKLLGGARSPGDETVGTEWIEGVIPIPEATIKGQSFRLQPAAQSSKPVDANGVQGLRLTRANYDRRSGESPDMRDVPISDVDRTSGQLTGIAKGTTGDGLVDVGAYYSLPSMSEIKYLDTTYPDTLIGEAQIEKRKVELKDASTNPRHLRANCIIRIR